MNFFLTALKLQIKTTLKLQIVTLILLLITLITTGIILKKQENALTINVGLVYDSNIKTHHKIYEILKQNKLINIIEYNYNQIEAFENDIKISNIECGYILSKDMEQKINEGAHTNIISSMSSPSSVATGIVDEAVLSSYIKATATHLAVEFLNSQGIDTTTNQISKLIEGYYKDDIFTNVNYIAKNSSHSINNDQLEIKLDLNRIFHGILSLFALIIIILHSAVFINNKQAYVYLKLKGATKIIFNGAIMANIIILNIINTSIGLLVVKTLFNNQLYLISSEILMLLAYTISLASLDLFLISTFNKPDIIFSLFPIVIISNIIFGGAFFDLSDINVTLRQISNAFLPFHYINGLNNNYLYESSILLVFSIVFVLIRGNKKT